MSSVQETRGKIIAKMGKRQRRSFAVMKRTNFLPPSLSHSHTQIHTHICTRTHRCQVGSSRGTCEMLCLLLLAWGRCDTQGDRGTCPDLAERMNCWTQRKKPHSAQTHELLHQLSISLLFWGGRVLSQTLSAPRGWQNRTPCYTDIALIAVTQLLYCTKSGLKYCRVSWETFCSGTKIS